VALEVLYALDHGGGDWRELVSYMATRSRLDSESTGFVSRLVKTCIEKGSELDVMADRASEHWNLDRMAAVDRSVIRLGAAQLMFMPDIPPKVAIDEAVELAKAYGGSESPAFVNGVLDNIAQACRENGKA
jgi:transcription antitermination factor NusB